MTKKHLVLASLLLLLATASCRKGCTCYAYNGDVVAYTEEEMESLGYDCHELEDINGGGLYSICDKSF